MSTLIRLVIKLQHKTILAQMNPIQINKKYIRQHVSKVQQPTFYQYFVQLHDVNQFNNWNLQRTIEVVNNFNRFHSKNEDKNSKETFKIKVLSPLQTLNSSIHENKYHGVSSLFPKEPIKSTNQKAISALNLLQEIQQQMIFSPRMKRSKISDDKERDSKLQKSNMSQNKTQESYRNKEQLFKKFNTLNVQSNKIQHTQQPLKQSIIIQKQLNSSKCEQKFSLQRSVEFKRQKSDLKNSIDLRQKKSSNSDKIFKWKLIQQLPCRKLNGKIEAQKIFISNHQMFHRYFLPDYVIYHILILPTNLICKRTYDQFLKLRSNLQKMFPCAKIPYLENGSWFSQSDITLINKNKANLQLFLNQLILHPTLSKAEIVRDFLTISDMKAIQSSLQAYSLISPIKKLSEVSNDLGSIKVVLSEQTHKLIWQLPKWQKYFQNYFDKYNDLISNLTSQYESIKLIFTQMVTLNYDFRMKVTQAPQIRTIIGNFTEFQGLLQKKQQYYDKKRKQAEINIQKLKDKLTTTLNYEKLNVKSFQTIIQSVQKLAKRYLERLENEPQSPSSGLQEQKIRVTNQNFIQTIWDDSQNITLFKYQVGYLNSKILEEINIYNLKLIHKLVGVFGQVFQMFQGRVKGEKDILL